MANDTPAGETTIDVGTTPPTFPEQNTDTPFIGADADTANGDSGRRGARQVVSDQAGKLGDQAGDRLRAFADDGKTRATGALDEIAKLIGDTAGTIDEKVGGQFGGYARNASTAVSDFAERLRGKDVDDLAAEAREFVRRSPAVAIGAATAIGFVLARVLRSGVDNRNA